MSTRPLLLSHAPASPMNPVVRHLFEKYFDIEEYRQDQQYDPTSTLIVVPNWKAEPWCQQLHQQGFRVAIDNLWETTNRYQAWKSNQHWDHARLHIMQNPNWFWYHESLRLKYIGFSYQPDPTHDHLALVQMRRQLSHRDRLHQALLPWLGDCYWSYLELGYHCLPGDADINDWGTQRYVNTNWYDHTCFSMVAETHDDYASHQQFGELQMPYQGPWPFVTEKTFKPIQYQHPFMVYGQKNTLKFLHNLGFETFENLFDESYDIIDSGQVNGHDHDLKLGIIVNNVKNFTKGPRDTLTQQKIQHNHAHFSNMAMIESRFAKEIVEPLLEFLQQTV
jgi:hypothetical protein